VTAVLYFSACRQAEDWNVFRGEGGRGATNTSVRPPFGIKWKLQLQNDGKTLSVFNPPIVKGDTIYFGSADGNFYALDIESGYMRWVYKTGGPINSVPCADERNVYFGSTDGNAYALSRGNGKLVWSFGTGRPVNSTFTRFQDTVMFMSDGGEAYFLSDIGELKYTLPNPVWHYNAFQVNDGIMYFAPGPMTQPHSLAVFDITKQQYLWLLDAGLFDAIWYSFPALHKDRLYFSTSTYAEGEWLMDYYAFDRFSGELLWHNYDNSRWGEGLRNDPSALFLKNVELLDFLAPAVWRNRILFSSGDSVIRAFEAATGKKVWDRQFPFPTSSSLAVAGDRVYFGLRGDSDLGGTENPRLVCLSAANGSFQWDLELEGAILAAPVIAGKWIIFGTDKSLFYILEGLF